MTNEEILCTFMEKRPMGGHNTPLPVLRWWQFIRVFGGTGTGEDFHVYETNPVLITLDRLHEIEARLTDEQWVMYEWELARKIGHLPGAAQRRHWIELSADKKIPALAAVLRPLVEGR